MDGTLLIFGANAKATSKLHKLCSPGVLCPPSEGFDAYVEGLYNPAMIREYPVRKNIHNRHQEFDKDLLDEDGVHELYRNLFLHPMLPWDFLSHAPAHEAAVEELGLQYPWQTPLRWAYPTADDLPIPPNEPPEPIDDLPDIASKECLKSAEIPWTQKKGTKVYLKVNALIIKLIIRPQRYLMRSRVNMSPSDTSIQSQSRKAPLHLR